MSGTDPENFTVAATVTGTTYSVSATDFVVPYDTTSNAITITLPAAASANTGRPYLLIQTKSSTNQMTLKTGGGTINGTAAGTGIALTASKIGMFWAVSDGTNWWAGGGTLVLS